MIVDNQSAESSSPKKRVVGRPFTKGDPRIRPSHKGGRPRDEFRAMLREAASSDTVLAGLQLILKDPSHPQFLKALEFAAERGYGKEVQPMEGGLTLTVVRRDESGLGDRGI